MTGKEKAESRLNCFYAAIASMGVNSANMASEKGRKRPTTEDILAEAKKISEWVTKEDEK